MSNKNNTPVLNENMTFKEAVEQIEKEIKSEEREKNKKHLK